jgi:hypothetical protein
MRGVGENSPLDKIVVNIWTVPTLKRTYTTSELASEMGKFLRLQQSWQIRFRNSFFWGEGKSGLPGISKNHGSRAVQKNSNSAWAATLAKPDRSDSWVTVCRAG